MVKTDTYLPSTTSDDGPSPPRSTGTAPASMRLLPLRRRRGGQLVPPQIDDSSALLLASTSASKERKQTQLSGDEGESNGRAILFF
jgi:hypothetical protein